MAVLGEYALTPDVFDSSCYGNDELCALLLTGVKDALLDDGLVKDLRDGEWHEIFTNGDRTWHNKGKELLKKLITQKRLIQCPAQGAQTPQSDVEWCHEALAVHGASPLNGIIVTNDIATAFSSEPIVAPIQKLSNTNWWNGRSPSLRLERTLADYRDALKPVLSFANSIMFIDPHLKPSLPRYHDFSLLLCDCGNRTPIPLIEVHRVCYEGSGSARQFPQPQAIEADFRNALGSALTSANVTIDIFVWDDFHDRYLISDLVGISLPNGFDTTAAARRQTTWTRLGRKDRDDLQREFDPASNRHALRHRFRIP